MVDNKNDFASVVKEKRFRKCSTSWESYQYLRDRLHDAWLPNSARQQLRRIIRRIQVQMHQATDLALYHAINSSIWTSSSEGFLIRRSLECQ
jgi:hypothetical protein